MNKINFELDLKLGAKKTHFKHSKRLNANYLNQSPTKIHKNIKNYLNSITKNSVGISDKQTLLWAFKRFDCLLFLFKNIIKLNLLYKHITNNSDPVKTDTNPRMTTWQKKKTEKESFISRAKTVNNIKNGYKPPADISLKLKSKYSNFILNDKDKIGFVNLRKDYKTLQNYENNYNVNLSKSSPLSSSSSSATRSYWSKSDLLFKYLTNMFISISIRNKNYKNSTYNNIGEPN